MEEATICAALAVPDAAQAADWLEKNLFFTQEKHTGCLQNGSCRLALKTAPAACPPPLAAGRYYTGPAHIALRTADIAAAQAHCEAHGLRLSLDHGHAFFNPQVYGGGEYYFNIAAPFGVTIEISQRADAPHYGETQIIEGLDHIGFPCADFQKQMQALTAQNFTPEFAPIENKNEQEGRICCCMLRRGAVTLELYQFMDGAPADPPQPAALTLPGIAME